jgi:hypothetical protein
MRSPSRGWESRPNAVPGVHADVGGVARQRGQRGVGVLDVEHRVVAGAPRPEVEVDLQHRVDRRPDQRVARGVDADGVGRGRRG